LEALLSQHRLPGEVLVADDGSGDETAAVVARLAADSPVPLVHVWQEDLGFRAAAARNRAAASASGDYLVFVDGDSIPCPMFVERHRRLAESGYFVVGNRVLLNPALTLEVEDGREHPCAWTPFDWMACRLRGRCNRLLPLFYLGDGAWRKRRPREWRGARTCNLGLWRSDFLAVNGFDERYHGWGHEDADLVARLIASGVLRKDGHWAVPVLHLWHPENDRTNESENMKRLEAVLANAADNTRAQLGVSRYLDRRE
jgi:glycosyltransferase involved in cell wall biosynthesis